MVVFFCCQAVVDAVMAIAKPNEPIDLFMVEIMEMKHKTDSDTQWVYGSPNYTKQYDTKQPSLIDPFSGIFIALGTQVLLSRKLSLYLYSAVWQAIQ